MVGRFDPPQSLSAIRIVDLGSRLLTQCRRDGGQHLVGQRVLKSPKVHVRDNGILHGPLELETLDDLLAHPVCAFNFEGHCIENPVVAVSTRRVPYFYRTQPGAENRLDAGKGRAA